MTESDRIEGPIEETNHRTEGREEVVGELSHLIHLRRYSELCERVDGLIEVHGWKETSSFVSETPIWKEASSLEWEVEYHKKMFSVHPVRQGRLRDALLRMFGLEMVTGIDVDFQRSFRTIKASDLQSLREKIIPRAYKRLTDQVRRRNTFFIDIEMLRDTPYERLVLRILKCREDEFTALGDSPSQNRASRTYYGFGHLTNSLTSTDRVTLEQLSESSITFSGKRPSYHKSAFQNCSAYLSKLLVHNLRVATARPQTQCKGAMALGVLGDSRALGVLHSVLKKRRTTVEYYSDPMNPVLYRAIWALGEIGHPSSLEHLRPFIGDFTFDVYAMDSISRLKSPDVVKVVLERVSNEPPRRNWPVWRNTSEKELFSQSGAVGALWRPQDERVIPHLVDLLQEKYVGDEALMSFLYLGESGHQALLENMDRVREAVKNSHRSRYLLREVCDNFPDISTSEAFIDLLVDITRGSTSTIKVDKVLKKFPALKNNDRIRDTLLLTLRRSHNPLSFIGDAEKLGLLDDPEFEETARKKIPVIARELTRQQWGGEIGFFALETICKVPILREAEEIQEALADFVRVNSLAGRVIRELGEHDALKDFHPIRSAVIERLSTVSWPIWFLEAVVETPELMRNKEVQVAVSEALRTFWSLRENARRSIRTDWDSAEFLWVYYLRPLSEYPEMGRIPEFQEAVASLLRFERYPDSLLMYYDEFEGLLESEPVRKETDRIAAEKVVEEERRRRRLASMRGPSKHEIEEEIRKAREAHWDHYDERSW